ncbi:DUF922 domain-containing protein [Candidatus Saccharibacteria bacterium]|nr:DUF922 domain-containing protein [Candidatus Saccharibacteria bacterium]
MHLLQPRPAEINVYSRTSRSTWLALLLSINVFLAATVIMLALSRSAIALPSTTETPTTTVTTSQDEDSSDTRVVPTKPAAIIIPSCKVTTYSLPAGLPVSDYDDGVHAVIDTPRTYAVYGNSVNAIWQQIARCSPVRTAEGRFAANTGYNLSSYYGYTTNGDGTCSMTQVAIGLHVNQVYPDWINVTGNDKLARTWQRFITNLQTHENGHAALDKQYANLLYARLKAIQQVDCSSIRSVISQTVKQVTTALDQANTNYDHKTNHGATQGAVM